MDPIGHFLLFAFHVMIVVSGLSLLFARRGILEKTYKTVFNLSPEYLRYLCVITSTFTSSLGVFLYSVEFTLGVKLTGPNSWLWVAQAIGSAVALLLVHLYLIRMQRLPGNGRETSPV